MTAYVSAVKDNLTENNRLRCFVRLDVFGNGQLSSPEAFAQANTRNPAFRLT